LRSNFKKGKPLAIFRPGGVKPLTILLSEL
jgi:hypothetical protein